MCKSKADGGFRCDHHAGLRYQELTAKFREEVLSSMGDATPVSTTAYDKYDAAVSERQKAQTAYDERSQELEKMLDNEDYEGYLKATGIKKTVPELLSSLDFRFGNRVAVHKYMKDSPYAKSLQDAKDAVASEVNAVNSFEDHPTMMRVSTRLRLAQRDYSKHKKESTDRINKGDYAPFLGGRVNSEGNLARVKKEIEAAGVDNYVEDTVMKSATGFHLYHAQKDFNARQEELLVSFREAGSVDEVKYKEAASAFMETPKGKKLLRSLAENEVDHNTPGIADMNKLRSAVTKAEKSGNTQAIEKAQAVYRKNLNAHNVVKLKNQLEAYEKAQKAGKSLTVNVPLGNSVVTSQNAVEYYGGKKDGRTLIADQTEQGKAIIETVKQDVNSRYEERVAEASAKLRYTMLSNQSI